MPEKWTYKGEDGVEVDAEPERWVWVVTYLDGTILKQFDDEGHYHRFDEIDKERLHSIAVLPGTPCPCCGNPMERPKLIVLLPDGAKPIIFPYMYRNICYDFGLPSERHYRLHTFGYQVSSTRVMFVIMPDDAIIITDDIDKIQVEEG